MLSIYELHANFCPFWTKIGEVSILGWVGGYGVGWLGGLGGSNQKMNLDLSFAVHSNRTEIGRVSILGLVDDEAPTGPTEPIVLPLV